MGNNEDKFGMLKTILALIGIIVCVPYWLCLTVFNTKLDFGTRLSYLLLSLPTALLLFEIIVVYGTMAVLFIPVALDSDAWPVGVFALICVAVWTYQLIKVIVSRCKKR